VGREKQRSEPLVFYHCVEKDRREAVFLFVVRWSLMALSEQSRHRNILVAIGLTADKVGFWLGILGAALQADFVVAFVARQSHHIGSYERRVGCNRTQALCMLSRFKNSQRSYL
jgi:hypothetical protein